MTKSIKITFIFFFLILVNLVKSQDQKNSISLKGNFTTTSRLYPSYVGNASDNYDDYFNINNLYGYGIEYKRKFLLDNLFIGTSLEYIYATNKTQAPFGLNFDDGYRIFLGELNFYLIIPFSTETIKFYIGGGIGFSVGERVKKILGVDVDNTKNPLSYGIQTLAGLEYFIFKNFSAKVEMKFRDTEVDVESHFKTSQLNYNNNIFLLNPQNYKSKINVDGIVFDLAGSFYF